jgi:hypothetical protein
MAVVIKLKGTAGFGAGTADWYRHETEALAGVTNLPSNGAIGLDNVILFPVTEAQADTQMVCSVILKTVIGDVRASVYQSKSSPGTLYVRAPQSREELENGEVKWHDEVKLTNKIMAQVLRFVETQVDVVVTEEPAIAGMDLPPIGGIAGVQTLVAGQTPVAGQAPQQLVPEDPFAQANAIGQTYSHAQA